jgi:CxxC motif-containing protein
MKHELTCIVCPRGCRIQVWEEEGVHRCEGNQCIRGEVYAIQEVTEPRRMFTSTVQLKGSRLKRCPVVSSSAIRKEDIFKLVDILENVVLEAPVALNQVVIENVLESGIDIIASRSIKKDAEAS